MGRKNLIQYEIICILYNFMWDMSVKYGELILCAYLNIKTLIKAICKENNFEMVYAYFNNNSRN